ncbi:MAG: hypothetical protein ACI4XE_10170 [Acutalibacteraceae bacterium]
MNGFSYLPDYGKTAVLILYTLIALAELYGIVNSIAYKNKSRDTAFTAVLFLLTMFHLTVLTMDLNGISSSALVRKTASVPMVFTGFVMILQLLAAIGLSYRMYRRYRTNVTEMSIKDGADKLPTGICCFDLSGRPKMTNHCMQNLCRELTGEYLLNAKEFWQKLQSGKVNCGNTPVKTGEEPIIILESGEVRRFACREIIPGKKPVYEISAADITEQYALSRQLMDSNTELEEMKKRLLRFNENVTDITREKEVLAAKIRIHNRLGKTLLISGRYLESEEAGISRREISDMWKSNISFLLGEAEQPDRDETVDELNEAADAMGISLDITGSLPESDNTAKSLILIGARECLTNAVHHAKAARLRICIFKENGYNIVEYTNDGILPEKEIAEGGGLSSLRKKAEDAGALMTVESKPRFCLRLKIPEKRD